MEQQASLKQCISEITGKQVGMLSDSFIYLDTKQNVSQEDIDAAFVLKNNKEKAMHNEAILKEIEGLDKDLIRPLAELMCSSSTQEVKDYAQVKVDEINVKKDNLRNQMLS